MKKFCNIVALLLFAASSSHAVTVTNLYHTNRTFRPTPHDYFGKPTPSAYQAWSMAGELSALVGPTNIFVISNQTYATEYEGFAWGYESANAAWTSAVAVYLNYTNGHPGMTFDNAGWVRGTKEAYNTWGAYLWLLQNTIRFESSKTNKWVSENGVTSQIVKVFVGSIGDYDPMTTNTDIGPTIGPEVTNFLGSGIATDVVLRADQTAYYNIRTITFTLYVDQPQDGGNRVPIQVWVDHFDLAKIRHTDVGHVFWRFDSTDTNSVPSALRPYLGVNMGFYPTTLVDLWSPISFGRVEIPDTVHMPDVNVTKVYFIDQNQLLNGLTEAKSLHDSPGNYNVYSRNCVNVALDVADAADLHLPRTKSMFKTNLYNGLSAADIGEDLKGSKP